MANATQIKFGYPDTLIAETPFWCLLTRPAQPTLGALVLVCKEPAQAFGELSAAAFAGLHEIIPRIEKTLRAAVDYQRINYLMLMMIDPDVHFHVLPRYDGTRLFEDLAVPDAGWPGPPALGTAVTPPPDQMTRLTASLRQHWAQSAW